MHMCTMSGENRKEMDFGTRETRVRILTLLYGYKGFQSQTAKVGRKNEKIVQI